MNQFVRIVRELEQFKESLRTIQTPVLQELMNAISSEIQSRLVNAQLEPMTEEELKMGRIDAIRSYRNRCGTSLRESMEAYRRGMETKTEAV
ncbi:hypothetical protein M0R72_17705 [Candidatus Pacearchaeota archaeon]|jgi:hypothetical protein|nr:hypothetical protein [Candidatus Pacearchaeota archaeon]